jgi:hypothetical protein
MLRSLGLTAIACLALAACGGTEEAATPPTAPPKPVPTDAVLAAWTDAGGGELFWADGRTMEPVNGRSYSVPFFYAAAELSPDGGVVALGGNDRGVVDVVDLRRMRSLGKIELERTTWVERLHWVEPDRILAVLWGERPRVAALQPGARKPISTHELTGTIVHSRTAGKGIVLLLAPARGIGPATLAVFDGDEVRSVDLPGVRAGWATSGEQEDYRARQVTPGLAIDPTGTRAVVVSPGNRVTEIDLGTLTVAGHDLVQQASLFERFRNWLEPGAWAKMIEGPELSAVWLPSGLIAVSGVSYSIEGAETTATPSGLSLVDPGNWSVRHVSDGPAWVTYRGGALLGSAWDEQTGMQTVHVFGPDGTPRFDLERRQADLSQTVGEHLYVATEDGAKYEIVDLGTGETVGRASPKRPAWIVYTE